MRTWRVRPDDPDPEILRQAVQLLAAGGLLAVPTETYYGIAADLRRPEALRRVQRTKGRGQAKPLLLLVADVAAARRLAPAASARLEQLAAAFWPGPLTLVLPAADGLPAAVVSARGGVAVRQSPHRVVANLLEMLGGPVTGTSANRAAAPPACTAAEIDLPAGSVDAVLDAGATPGGPPSTLLDLIEEPPRVLRPGCIAPEALARLL